MNFLISFISEYGNKILYAITATFGGLILAHTKTLYKKVIDKRTKNAVIEASLKAVEQLYNDFPYEEKVEIACESIIADLDKRGVYISELEMRLIIKERMAKSNLNFTEEKK